jgi:hypothetical protein
VRKEVTLMQPPNEDAYLLARAECGRRAVREGADPWIVLYLVLCPSPEVKAAEAKVPIGTIHGRASNMRKLV